VAAEHRLTWPYDELGTPRSEYIARIGRNVETTPDHDLSLSETGTGRAQVFETSQPAATARTQLEARTKRAKRFWPVYPPAFGSCATDGPDG